MELREKQGRVLWESEGASSHMALWEQVLHDMLELVSDVNETSHASYLEWIVIWLILVCAVIGVFEVLGTLGIVGPGHHFP